MQLLQTMRSPSGFLSSMAESLLQPDLTSSAANQHPEKPNSRPLVNITRQSKPKHTAPALPTAPLHLPTRGLRVNRRPSVENHQDVEGLRRHRALEGKAAARRWLQSRRLDGNYRSGAASETVSIHRSQAIVHRTRRRTTQSTAPSDQPCRWSRDLLRPCDQPCRLPPGR